MKPWEKEEIELDDHSRAMAQMPVIVSASRSTDIPAFYADWFMSRFLRKDGYVRWTNPFNGVPLYVGFRKTRLIVFWSKNPKKLLPYLRDLDERGINYYFQFTLNDYDDEDIEPGVASLAERIETFKRLSDHVGPERVVWRFDPLILSDKLPVDVLLRKIEGVGNAVAQYTSRFVFSFVDIAAYRRVGANLEKGRICAREFSQEEIVRVAKGISEFTKRWKISAGTCGEHADLSAYGIEHNRCIDDRLIFKCFQHDSELMRFIGAKFVPGAPLLGEQDRWVLSDDSYKSRRDKGQRENCGCIASKDIGEYNTCPHFCRYCYANASNASANANWKRHCDNPGSDSITGMPELTGSGPTAS